MIEEISIILFDMNKLIIEKEQSILLHNILKEYMDLITKDELSMINKGFRISGARFEITDDKRFTMFLLSYIFENYEIINTTGYRDGHPDFILKSKDKNKEDIYLEIKFNEDALRDTQLKWFTENKDKNCKIMWIKMNSFKIDEYPIHKYSGDYL